MKGKFNDFSGQTIGNCEVYSRVGTHRNGDALWSCRCLVCGKKHDAPSRKVKLGSACSIKCGVSASNTARSKHGEHKHPDYLRWRGIKNRCYLPKSTAYHRYGGRGVKMHPPWIDDYQAFASYIRSLPNYGLEGVTLDRINNDGHYEPGNLRWATWKQQAVNRENNVYLEVFGMKKTLSEWAEFSGLGRTLIDRYYAGDRGERLFRKNRWPSN